MRRSCSRILGRLGEVACSVHFSRSRRSLNFELELIVELGDGSMLVMGDEIMLDEGDELRLAIGSNELMLDEGDEMVLGEGDELMLAVREDGRTLVRKDEGRLRKDGRSVGPDGMR